MGYAQIRSSGSLLYTKLKGAARVGGVSTLFGPQPAGGGGGPTYESVTWPQEPADTDNIDSGQAYNMGIRFSVTTSKNCTGIRWRVPDVISNTPPGGTHVASVWAESGSNRVAFKNFTPVTGGYQDILFDTPIVLSSGAFYVAAVYTYHYVFRTSSASVSSPSGNLVAQGGRLVAYNGGPDVYPDGSYGSWYYISPIVEV
jgi:hypothetical protein